MSLIKLWYPMSRKRTVSTRADGQSKIVYLKRDFSQLDNDCIINSFFTFKIFYQPASFYT